MLRNGQVLQGEVTQAGDYYVVTLGGTSEIRLKAAEVEAVCASLDEAYEFKVGHLSGSGARPHLELAEWCLRHDLHARCAQQLVAAMRLEPDNPGLKLLERRLEFAAQQPKERDQATLAAASAIVSSEQMEQAIRDLPAGSVEKFAAVIQPILLNRCGANQCHGPNAKSEFRLLRPSPGQVANRRFTQRNLYAALEQLDRSQPEASPLLTLPQRRHGTSLTAVFDKHSQKQLDDLAKWINITLASPQAPPTIPAATPTLLQSSSDAFPKSTAPAPPAAMTPGESSSTRVMKPAVESAESKSAAAAERFVPRDRFDPEIFNRRYQK